MIRRAHPALRREEDGIALVIAIATMSILAITTAGVMVAGTANENTAWTSTQGRAAFAVAQQALAYGEGMVYADIQASPTVDAVPHDAEPPDAAGRRNGTYSVTQTRNDLAHRRHRHRRHGVAHREHRREPDPDGYDVHVDGHLVAGLYENDPVGSLTTCPITGGTVISVPISRGANICMTNAASKILNTLEVGGKLFTSGGASIGLASARFRCSGS